MSGHRWDEVPTDADPPTIPWDAIRIRTDPGYRADIESLNDEWKRTERARSVRNAR
jgi:hypothetical protein